MIDDDGQQEPPKLEAQSNIQQLQLAEWNQNGEMPITQPPEVMSPLSFAFSAAEKKSAFNFPNLNNNDRRIDGLLNLATVSEQAAEELEKKTQSTSEACASQSSSQGSVKTAVDLEVVDDGENSDECSESSQEAFEPKSHVGWASFGETIVKPKQKPESEKDVARSVDKRKLYVVRTQSQLKNKKYPLTGNTDTPTKPETNSVEDPNLENNAEQNIHSSPSESSNKPRNEEDEEVDVVGFTPEKLDNEALKAEDNERYLQLDDEGNSVAPPDLPPQRPQSSRFEKQRLRKDLNSRRLCDNDEAESYYRKRTRLLNSPPPCLERETDDVPVRKSRKESGNIEAKIEFGDEDMDVEDEEVVVDDETGDEPKLHPANMLPHNPNQLLKTKVSTSSIPVLPMSKCIMERKKVAVEKSRHSFVRRVVPNKGAVKNITVAPKMYQIPAYSDRSAPAYYANSNRVPVSGKTKESRGGCHRCSDNSYFSVDMSTFRFTEETTAIAVRAHLCDQTRVMIARTALWNREYARKLGDRAVGTLWQKPDEVTAQMTGFCSATVKRCIEIANLSMVPKCADRIGVSKQELNQLKNTFSEDAKFCDQPMRSPHVLNQFYQMKTGSQAVNAVKKPTYVIQQANKATPQKVDANPEKDNYKNETVPMQRRPFPTTQPPPLPPKKTILRWSTIHPTPKYPVGQSSSTRPPVLTPAATKANSTAVITKKVIYKGPVRKTEDTAMRRGRGRPKKEKEDDEYVEGVQQAKMEVMKKVQQRFSKRIPRRANEIEETVKEVVQRMVDAIVIEDSLE